VAAEFEVGVETMRVEKYDVGFEFTVRFLSVG
jgi:hypothetical protein